jgi:transcription initiation factor TFIIF subunit alpha
MSASPQPPGPGRTPNGGPAIIRRSKTSDPLVRKKNPRNQRRQLPVNPKVTSSQDNSGGATLSTSNAKSASSQSASAGRDGLVGTQESDSKSDTRPKDPRGFSTAVEDCRYFDLVTTKQEILEGLRYHVARFASKKSIDPRDEEEFTRPVRLHRRDPRAPPAGAGGRNGQEDSPDGDSKDNIPDDRERERQEIIREEKEAKRKADLAQIAPTAHSGNNQRRQNAFKKKTQQVFRTNETPEQRAQSKLRYEEAIPWHLEDFDNKNTWVGNYESALSGTYCMLEVSEQKFRMVPMEKWYRFTPKNQFKTLTTEEAEAILGKKVSQPRWIMDSLRKGEGQRMSTADRQAGSNLYIGQFGNKALGRKTGVATKSEAVDADDLDFDEDRFADDEENPVMDGDVEETKDTEERIKRDQLQANIFDLKDEKEIDKEAEEEKRANELKKKEGKGTKKALMAREKNYIYDSSDSDENPYESKVSDRFRNETMY